jgi:hypothetical protein
MKAHIPVGSRENPPADLQVSYAYLVFASHYHNVISDERFRDLGSRFARQRGCCSGDAGATYSVPALSYTARIMDFCDLDSIT